MCTGDSASGSELAQLLPGRCLPPGTAVGAAAAVPQPGLGSLPEAAKDWRRQRARDLVRHRGVVGDALVSLMGGAQGERGKWNQDETGIKQPHARQPFLLPGLLWV